MIHLFKYLKKKDWFYIFIALCLIIAQVAFELKMPDYTKELTKLVQSQTDSMTKVWQNGGLMLLCALCSLICSIICSFFISKLSSSFSRNLRDQLFRTITNFSTAEINKFSTPSLITRTTNDVVQIQNFMSMGIQMLFKAPIMSIWAICKISKTDVRWTYATIICVVIIVVCIGILVALCLPRFKKIQKLTDDLNNITRENISGVRVIRAFNAEKFQEEKFDKVNEKITKTNLFTNKTMGIMSPIMNVCMNGLTIAIYWIGAVIINEVSISNGMELVLLERAEAIANMTAFTSYAMRIVMSFMILIAVFIILPRTVISGNRIWEVLKTKSSINNGDKNNITDQGTIEFKNVSFAYNDSSENTLNDISFKINKGETLAIVGATGSGKTTLVNLMLRFYDVTDGEVLVDGVNVKDYKLKELRDKIAIATQKASLFKGTIKENIVYGNDEINDELIKKSLEISQSEFVNELQNGVDSSVAQGGTNFSGGQKQRLSIARTIYKNSEIMIFDDTFSALDYKTDLNLRRELKKYTKDATTLIVASRIGTILHADKIIVLENGCIVGMGRHEELIKDCEIYKEIAISQLGEEVLK